MTDIEIEEVITKINQLSKERRIKFNIYNTGETLDLIQICHNIDKNTLELSFRDEGREYVDELKKLSEEINLKLQKIENMKKRHKTYKEWKDEYEHKEIVNLSNEFSKKEIEIIKKLGYKIEIGKSYTAQEFDILIFQKIMQYKIEEDMSEEELELIKPLHTTEVSQKQYDKLLSKIETIYNKYF